MRRVGMTRSWTRLQVWSNAEPEDSDPFPLPLPLRQIKDRASKKASKRWKSIVDRHGIHYESPLYSE